MNARSSIRQFVVACLLGAAAASTSLVAQTLGAPRLPPQVTLPIQIAPETFDPTIELDTVTSPAIGRIATARFRISGLRGAKAVHLYRFSPGCSFEQQLATSGLSLRLENGASDRRRYTTDSPRRNDGGLAFREPGEGELRVDARGEATLSIQGVFGVGPGTAAAARLGTPPATSLQTREAMDRFVRTIVDPPGTCTPSAAFVFVTPDGKWRSISSEGRLLELTDPSLTDLHIRSGPPWHPRPRTTFTVTATKVLRDLLSPTMRASAAGSTCDGVSGGLGQTPHRVGVREQDDDLTFTIRSGPAGTRCAINFSSANLPEGVTVTAARFSVSKDGNRCRLGSSTRPGDFAGPPVVGPGFALDRVSSVVRAPEPLVDGTVVPATNGWLNPFRFPESASLRIQWQAHFAPMLGALTCDATAGNDHGVTLHFDSAEFRVPDGLTLGLPQR